MKQYEQKAREILKQMTTEEKAGLLSGKNFWQTKGVERLSVDGVMVTDGPHGLRKQSGSSDHLGLNESVPATCFPTAATTACSFDTELLQEIGEALGEECLQEQVAVILGPGANIKRSPLCGRNFEYFSEDPLLTGKMASALIQGVQSKGIGTSLKHFAANNQEALRLVIDAVIDERALREIYLTGFETAVKEARPWTLMCSYNQINGEFSSQNDWLLNQVLREEWGFEGAVVTDWGAVVDRVKGVAAGLDLEMPYTGPENDQAIVDAVNNGSLKTEILDKAAERMLCLLLAAAENRKDGYQYDVQAHHELAAKAAAQSAVLLKNEDILPVKEGQQLAVIGAFAREPRYQGAGSSRINPNRLDNLCTVLKDRNVSFTYADGYNAKSGDTDEEMIAEARKAAEGAEVCVVCIGLPDEYESEGFDRSHMRLPEGHCRLLETVAEVNSNVVVLLFGGSAVEMPWINSAKAILMLYLGGEAGAQAAADLLYGKTCPSGRLAESFPLRLEDTPSYANFPGGDRTVEYRESIYVGYRYYDKAGADVLFPFGYGLSYTQFAYRELAADVQDGKVTVTVNVKNTGSVAGAEVVQFYVGQKNPSIFRPLRELKSFSKVFLQPGEEKSVRVVLERRAFAFYRVETHDWCVETGEYVISAASSSRDIRCEQSVRIEGTAVTAVRQEEYENPGNPLHISGEAFEAICGRALPPGSFGANDPYTMNTTIFEAARTGPGAMLLAQIEKQMASMVQGSGDGMELMLKRQMKEMPLRSLKMFSGGAMTAGQLQGIIDAMNAEKQKGE